MHLRRIVPLRGPNIWANFPVLELTLDLGEYRDSPSNTLPGFSARIMGWLPSMVEHRCGLGVRGGFFQRLIDGTYLGHILEHVALELQSLAGADVGYGKARELSELGVYKVIVEYEDEEVGKASVDHATALIRAALTGQDFDAESAVETLRALRQQRRQDAATESLIRAASARGIPHVRLGDSGLVQLGYGKWQQRIWRGRTAATEAIGLAISERATLRGTLLRAAGLPVADEGCAVTHRFWVVGHQVVRVTAVSGTSLDPSAAQPTEHVTDVALFAARVAGLSVATVDMVHGENSGWAIASVHAGCDPAALRNAERSRELGEAIVSDLFRSEPSGRIPIVAVSGASSRRAATRALETLLREAGWVLGTATADGSAVGTHVLERRSAMTPEAAQRVLVNPRADGALFEVTDRSVLDCGLGFDACTLAVVTDLDEPVGTRKYIDDAETIAKAKRAAVDVVLPNGFAVLNATRPEIAAMAEHCRGKVVYFARSAQEPVLARHAAEGGALVYGEGENVVLARGASRIATLSGALRSRAAGSDVDAVLAASGAAWVLGVPVAVLRHVLARPRNVPSARLPGAYA